MQEQAWVAQVRNGGARMWHPVSFVARLLSPLADHFEDVARYLSLAAVVLTLLLSVQGRVLAETAQHYARLSHVDGQVQVLQGDQTAFAQAVPNMPLAEGSRLQTGDDGRAEVQFENGSIARLTPKSSMTLTQIQRGPDGAANTQVEMLSGLGYFELRSRGGEDSLVFGPNTIIPVDGSAIVRMNMDANPVELSVVDGNIHVTSGTQFAVDVHANETIRFDATDGARYFLAEEVTADSWDGWNNDRDQALSQQAMKRTEASQAAVNSGGGGMGWSDLDQNGNWYSMPGYGNVWAPYGMTAGWDPYGSGYWGNYGGAGYAWISGYSWGWTPYRCGGWNYFNSFGWGWMPNGCGGFGGGGWGVPTSIVILNYPRGYLLPKPPQGVHPPLRPGPPTGVGMAKNGGSMLIPVNRGPAATQLKPMNEGTVQPAKPIVVNGSVIHPLPLRPVAENSFARGTTIHPVTPTQQAPGVNVYHIPAPANSVTEPVHGTAVAPVARPAASATQVISTPTQLLTPAPVARPVMSAPVASQPRTVPASAPLPQVMVPSAPTAAAHPVAPTTAPRYVPPPTATQAPRYNPPPSSAQGPPRYSPPPSYSPSTRSSPAPSSMGGGGGGGGSHPSGGGGGQPASSHK
jgi:FecR protein